MAMNEEMTEPIIFEPIIIPDLLVTGMLPVEIDGELVRLTLFVDRRCANGVMERIIVGRLVMTQAAFERNMTIGEQALRKRRHDPGIH